MATKTPRQGATIERSKVLAKMRALKRKFYANHTLAYSDLWIELETYIRGRAVRTKRAKGGL